MKSTHQPTFAIKRLTLWMIIACGITLARCSSNGQGEDPQEPVNAADGLNNASLNSNAPTNGTSATAAKQGAAMNNATAVQGNNFAGANGTNLAPENTGIPEGNASGNILTNNISGDPLTNPISNQPTNTTSVPLNQTQTSNSLLPGNSATLETPPSNSAPTNATASTAPVAHDSAPKDAAVVSWDKMNASPYLNPQSNWKAKGKVKYITRRITKHASPDGPVVGEYNVGNHPLVYQNGNWAELSNGTYVKGNATTDKPVGYEQKPLLAH